MGKAKFYLGGDAQGGWRWKHGGGGGAVPKPSHMLMFLMSGFGMTPQTPNVDGCFHMHCFQLSERIFCPQLCSFGQDLQCIHDFFLPDPLSVFPRGPIFWAKFPPAPLAPNFIYALPYLVTLTSVDFSRTAPPEDFPYSSPLPPPQGSIYPSHIQCPPTPSRRAFWRFG